MKVAVLSAFRNATGYLARYFQQMECLRAALFAEGHTLHLVLGEGDSVDMTFDMLTLLADQFVSVPGVGVLVDIVDVTHGGSVYGSIEHPGRFRDLAYVGNTLWSHRLSDTDVAMLVESDLIWQAQTLTALIDDLAHVEAVAPMVLDSPPANTFYDVYAFRRGGVRFTKEPPYHADLRDDSDLLQLDSAGSVLAIRGELARQLHWPEEDVVVGLCRQIYAWDAAVWLDCNLTVYHP